MLLSKFVNELDINNPLSEYPRPQLVRDSYLNLNGKWDFIITTSSNIPETFDSVIIVPFCVESYLSGINKKVNKEQYLYYKKIINFPKHFIKDKVILHFGAVDQLCKVYINKQLVITNDNGYLPFSVDIKPYLLDKDNEIIVQVKDELDHNYLYGKQRNDRGGMWYTPVSGIWQSVWIESVSEDYIENLTITPDIDNNQVNIIIKSTSPIYTLKILDEGKVIFKEKQNNGIFKVNIKEVKLWSPENPFLYNIEVSTKHDEIKSYFAMRKFSVNEKCFMLNNKPYFIHGLLDQGYFPEGIYTPATYKAYENDILMMKKLGFNTLRKHIKIEPMMFYYYCDVLGMLIFQDFVNNGNYSFIIDTAMPTIKLDKLAKLFKSASIKQKEVFKKASIDTLNYLYNVPSIVYYTIFNEGWGQHDSDYYYEKVKQIDNTRVYDSTSGWFKGNNSDVESLHVYFKPIKLKPSNKPIIVSEFGGYAYPIKDHEFNTEKVYGYKKFNNSEDFNKAIVTLFETDIINNIKHGLAGSIYTQVSDVEDETNGLLTYDRKILKVNEKDFKEIKNKVDKEIYHD